MNYRELLQKGRSYLQSCGVPDADVDAWLLFEYVTKIDRTHYFLRQTESCDAGWQEKYEKLIEKRGQRIPLQYLTGQQEFMGLSFSVNEHVLIPRQDTELLVAEALKRITKESSVLDMCTGSGCIIISLQKLCGVSEGCVLDKKAEKRDCGNRKGRFTAVDISEEALLVARGNAVCLEADVEFVRSDLFESVDGKYDCIVSNPPYIKTIEIQELMPEVRDHEPPLALDGLEDGLHFYRRIIKDAPGYLKSGGWLLFEIGFDQGKAVSALMEEQGYTELEIKKDLAGLDRVVIGKSR